MKRASVVVLVLVTLVGCAATQRARQKQSIEGLYLSIAMTATTTLSLAEHGEISSSAANGIALELEHIQLLVDQARARVNAQQDASDAITEATMRLDTITRRLPDGPKARKALDDWLATHHTT